MDRSRIIEDNRTIPESKKKVTYVNIDSRNRNRLLHRNTNDYNISLEEPLYGIDSVELVSAEIPKTHYLIDSGNDTIQVAVDPSLDHSNTSLTDNNFIQIAQLDSTNFPLKYVICYIETGNLSNVVLRVVDLSSNFSPISIQPYSSTYSIVNPSQSSYLDSFSLDPVSSFSTSSVRSKTSVINAYSKISVPGGFVRVSSVDLDDNSISHGSEVVLPGVSGIVYRKSGVRLSNQRAGIAYSHGTSTNRVEFNVGGTGATDVETRLTNSIEVASDVESYRISSLHPPRFLGGSVVAYVTSTGLYVSFVGVGLRSDNYRIIKSTTIISSSVIPDGSYSITSTDNLFICVYVSNSKINITCGSIYTSTIQIEHTAIVSEILESNPYLDCCLSHESNLAYVVSSDGSNLILRDVTAPTGVARPSLSLSPGAVVRFYMDGVTDFYLTDSSLGGNNVISMRIRGASRGIGKTSFRESDVVGEGTDYVVLHIPRDADTTDLFHYQSVSHPGGGSTVSISSMMTSNMSLAIGYSGSHYVNNNPFEWGSRTFSTLYSNKRLDPPYIGFPSFQGNHSEASATPFGAVLLNRGEFWTYTDGSQPEWKYWGGSSDANDKWPGGRSDFAFSYSGGCAYLFGGYGAPHTETGESAFSPIFSARLLNSAVEVNDLRTNVAYFDSLVVSVTDTSGVTITESRNGIGAWTGGTSIPSFLGKADCISISPSSSVTATVVVPKEVTLLGLICVSINASSAPTLSTNITNSSALSQNSTHSALKPGEWNYISYTINDSALDTGNNTLTITINNLDSVYSLVICDTHVVPRNLTISTSSSSATCQVAYSLQGAVIDIDTRNVSQLTTTAAGSEVLNEFWKIRVDSKTLNSHIVQYGFYNTVSAQVPITLANSIQSLISPHTISSQTATEGLDGTLIFTGQEVVVANNSGKSINSIGSSEFSLSARVLPDKYVVQFAADYSSDLSDSVSSIIPTSNGSLFLSGFISSPFPNGGSVSISSGGYLQYTLPHLVTYSVGAYIRCNIQPNQPVFTYIVYQDMSVSITDNFTVELRRGTDLVGQTTINYNQWIHVYFQRTNSSVEFFVNDTLIGSLSVSSSLSQSSSYLTLNAGATIDGVVTPENRQVGNSSIYSWVWVWEGVGRGVLHRQGVPFSRNHVIAGAINQTISGNRVMLYISNSDFKLHGQCMGVDLTHTLSSSEILYGVYVTLRRKDDRLFLYIDGVESSQSAITSGINIGSSDNIFIGGEKVSNGIVNMYSGSISLVRLMVGDSITTEVYTDADLLWSKKSLAYGPFETDTLDARSNMGASMVDSIGNIWMFGGVGISGLHNDLWSYDVTSDAWVKYGTGQSNATVSSDGSSPGARRDFTCAINASNEIFIYGGRGDYTGPSQIYHDLWKYTITGASAGWSLLSGGHGVSISDATASTPGTRTIGFSVCTGDDFVMVGGYSWTGTTSGFNMIFTRSTADNDIWYWSESTQSWAYKKTVDSLVFPTASDAVAYNDIRFSSTVAPEPLDHVAFWPSSPRGSTVFNMISDYAQWANQLNGFVQEQNLSYLSVARIKTSRTQVNPNSIGSWTINLTDRTLALSSAFQNHIEILPLPRRLGSVVLHYGGARVILVDIENQTVNAMGAPSLSILNQVVLSRKSDLSSSATLYYAYKDVTNSNYGVVGEITISNVSVSYGSTAVFSQVNPSTNVAITSLQDSGFAAVAKGSSNISVSHWNGSISQDTTVAMSNIGSHTFRLPSGNRIPTNLTDLDTFNVNTDYSDKDNIYYNDFYSWIISSVLTTSTTSKLRVSVQRLLHQSPIDIVQNVIGESIAFLSSPLVISSSNSSSSDASTTHVKTLVIGNGGYSVTNETVVVSYMEGSSLFMSYVNCLYFDPFTGVGSPPSQASIPTPTLINTSVQAGSYHMCEIHGATESTIAVCYITTAGVVNILSYTWTHASIFVSPIVGDVYTVRTESENVGVLELVDDGSHVNIMLESNTNSPEFIKIQYSYSSGKILFGGSQSGTKWKRIGLVEPVGNRIYDINLEEEVNASVNVDESRLRTFSSGLEWVFVGNTTPSSGSLISNLILEGFLNGTAVTLTKTQRDSTGISRFSTSNYVFASGQYYRPLGYFSVTGLSWRLVGLSRPDGIAISNSGLESALATTQVFTQSEWSSFSVGYVHMYNYVSSNGVFYIPNLESTFTSRDYIISKGVYYKPYDIDCVRLISDHSTTATYNVAHYSSSGTALYVPSYSYSNFQSVYISQRNISLQSNTLVQIRPTFTKNMIHGDYPGPDNVSTELTSQLQLIDNNFAAVTFNTTTFKFIITNSASPFSFVFAESNNIKVEDVENNLGLGYILGCRTLSDESSVLQSNYSNLLIPASRADLSGHAYLYLYLTTDQYSITNETSTISALSAFGRIPLSVAKGSIMFFTSNSHYEVKASELKIPVLSSIRVRLGRYAYSRTRQVTLYEPQGVEHSLCLRIVCNIDHTGSAAAPPPIDMVPMIRNNILESLGTYMPTNQLGQYESDSYSELSD